MTSDKQSAGEYMYKLDSLGYTFNKKTNIWIRSGYEDIGYNDGDSAEERLAQIVRDASDISIFLQNYVTNASIGKHSTTSVRSEEMCYAHFHIS